MEYICRIWQIYSPSSLTIDNDEEPIKMHVSFILSLLCSCASMFFYVKIWSGKSNSYVFSHWRISISRTHADACALSIGSEARKSSDQDGELTKLESILFIPNVGYKQKKSIFWTCVKKILLPSEDIRCMPNFEVVRKLFINWVELSQRVDVLPTISAASSVFLTHATDIAENEGLLDDLGWSSVL